MPFFKQKMIFSYPGYGWQEVFYNSTATSTTDALDVLEQLVPARTALLNNTTVLEEIQASQEPDPAWTIDTPDVNPLAVRGDSKVRIPTRAKQLALPQDVGNKTDDLDPWQAIQFQLRASPGQGENGPFYQRQTHLRGIGINYFTGVNTAQLTFRGDVVNAVAAYIQKLADLKMCIRAADKSPVFTPITGMAIGPVAHTVKFITGGLPAGLKKGGKITVKGWPRGTSSWNGVYTVVDLIDGNPVIADLSDRILLVQAKSKLALRPIIYVPIIAPPAPAGWKGGPPPPPVLRLRKRDTGRELWTSKGRQKGRKVANP